MKNTKGLFCSVSCKNKDRYLNKPEFYRAKALKVYGLTVDQYDAMENKQQGRCYICNQYEIIINTKTKLPYRLCVDHNHITGQVRKLLCRNCNLLVGQLENKEELVKKCVNYLDELKKVRG
jgi:hypothetical protein